MSEPDLLTLLATETLGDFECRLEPAMRAPVLSQPSLPMGRAGGNVPTPPHSVVTLHLIDRAGEPTRAAVDEILACVEQRLI